jgi:hypothetical protein
MCYDGANFDYGGDEYGNVVNIHVVGACRHEMIMRICSGFFRITRQMTMASLGGLARNLTQLCGKQTQKGA